MAVVKPGVPAKPNVTAGIGQVSVAVAAGTAGGVPKSYTVNATTTTAGAAAGTCTVTGVSRSCDVTGLTGGATYTVKATATNAAGTSRTSSPSATFTQMMAPGQPGIGAVSSIAPTTATVTFTACCGDVVVDGNRDSSDRSGRDNNRPH